MFDLQAQQLSLAQTLPAQPSPTLFFSFGSFFLCLTGEKQPKQTAHSLLKLCRGWTAEDGLPDLPHLLKCAGTSLTFVHTQAANGTQMNKDLYITYTGGSTSTFLIHNNHNSASSTTFLQLHSAAHS